MYVYVYVCMMVVSWVPLEARRGCQILWRESQQPFVSHLMWTLRTSVTHLFNPKCSFLVITFIDHVALKIDTIKLKMFSKKSLLTCGFLTLKSSLFALSW